MNVADLCLLFSSIGFILSLIPCRIKKYLALLGWTGIVSYLIVSMPHYIFDENNFVYPLIGILAIPPYIITARALFRDEPVVNSLTKIAAVAWLIYAPFYFIEPLGNWLVGLQISHVSYILDILGQPVGIWWEEGWNTIARNGYRIQIILGCTGIQSIAIMLGVIAAVQTTWRQRILSFVLVFFTIYIMNIVRNVFVIFSYSEQLFPFLPEISSNGSPGYESYFWAHNVISEVGLSLVTLIIVAFGLFSINPALVGFVDRLLRYYYHKLLEMRDSLAGKIHS